MEIRRRADALQVRQPHAERASCLNPSGLSERKLNDRTLTTCYNALQVFHVLASGRMVPTAGDTVPRLAALHDALDCAMCDAYSWEHEVLNDEGKVLR